MIPLHRRRKFHPTGRQALCLPGSRPKKEPRVSERERGGWFNGLGVVPERPATCVDCGGEVTGHVPEADVRLAPGLEGDQQKGVTPLPF